jgi:hypothetical protein
MRQFPCGLPHGAHADIGLRGERGKCRQARSSFPGRLDDGVFEQAARPLQCSSGCHGPSNLAILRNLYQ